MFKSIIYPTQKKKKKHHFSEKKIFGPLHSSPANRQLADASSSHASAVPPCPLGHLQKRGEVVEPWQHSREVASKRNAVGVPAMIRAKAV